MNPRMLPKTDVLREQDVAQRLTNCLNEIERLWRAIRQLPQGQAGVPPLDPSAPVP